MFLENTNIVYFNTDNGLEEQLQETFFSEIIHLAKFRDIKEGYIIFINPYMVGNVPEYIRRTAETLAVSGMNNLIILATAFVRSEEFPDDQYYMIEITDPEDIGDRTGYSFEEVLSRQCSYLEEAGFRTINNVCKSEFIIPYIYTGNEIGDTIVKTAGEIAEYIGGSIGFPQDEEETTLESAIEEEPEVDNNEEVEIIEDAIPPVESEYRDSDDEV